MRHFSRLTLVLAAAIASAYALAINTGFRDRLPEPVADSDFYDGGKPSQSKVQLGRFLFFDKILSGNKNISCATCHHPALGTSDALALPLGEGPHGLGPDRKPDDSLRGAVHERVPRNSPALFNLGAREFTRMFHDGRVENDTGNFYQSGFITPAKWKLPQGLDNVLAAQAMFPVTSHAEMAGQKGENSIADAIALNNAGGPGGVWEQLAKRLQTVAEYVELFSAAFPQSIEVAEDITFVHAANAIAAFEASAFRADNSPFDRYLRGDNKALTVAAKRGAQLFYGKAECARCHSGKFQTDHEFHAIAMPQIGPGKADGWDAAYWSATGIKAFAEDFGRGRVTTRKQDRYKFRTPSLRNVALSGPWGHAGAYPSLEAVVRHHLSPVTHLHEYELPANHLTPLPGVLEITASGSSLSYSWLRDTRLAGFLQRDTWVQGQAGLRQQIAAANELTPMALNDDEVNDLLAFLHSLTDASAENLNSVVPERVPSGLPVED